MSDVTDGSDFLLKIADRTGKEAGLGQLNSSARRQLGQHHNPLTLLTSYVNSPTVILSFACAQIERLFRAQTTRRFPSAIQRSGRRKLLALDAATELRQMAVPPGNRLEALKGDRKGQYSIRVNDQWRICFRWQSANAHDVEIVDYY